MCTSIRLKGESMYFGRNMDIECSFGEKVTLTPRRCKINFREEKSIENHYAILGTAKVIDSYPLYADAFNEKGLCIAGLNFPKNTHYINAAERNPQKYGITPFELPLFLLSQCENVEECKSLLKDTEIINTDFSEKVKLTPLHWHIADNNSSLTVECLKEGMTIRDNKADVLANNPPFDMQIQNLALYQNLTPGKAENFFSSIDDFDKMGKGYGSVGIPGDFSSPSRFVKAAYLAGASRRLDTKEITLPHLFSLLRSVAVPKGGVMAEERIHHTLYTCGMDIDKKIYSVSYYDSLSVKSVCMYDENLDSTIIAVK